MKAIAQPVEDAQWEQQLAGVFDRQRFSQNQRLERFIREVFTGSVAVVDQDMILFEDTIANNIKMWDNSIRDFEVILAARDACLHQDIMEREGGYQYRMLEGDTDLSGRQRQRLEIARVLAQDPTLIMMDEATSALDSKTEYPVTQAIANRGITCIVVAHRLSTIRDCDRILVLDQGKIQEEGTYDQLIQKNALFTSLIRGAGVAPQAGGLHPRQGGCTPGRGVAPRAGPSGDGITEA